MDVEVLSVSERDTSPPFGTYPLRRIVPEIDELLADPATLLTREPVCIGKLKVPVIMYVLGALVIGLLGYAAWRAADPGDRRWWAIVFILPAFVFVLVYFSLPGRRSMVLRKDGIEIEHGDTVVWCPWSLFAVDGRAIVTDLTEMYRTIVLPVSPAAVSLVELRRNGVAVARGQHIKAKQLHFLSDADVEMKSRYEVHPQELGDLLLQLGNILGRKAPSAASATETAITAAEGPKNQAAEIAITASSPSAIAASPLLSSPADSTSAPPLADHSATTAVSVGRNGWVTIALTRLQFPRLCCKCGGRATVDYEFEIAPYVIWPLRFLARYSYERLKLTLPWCSSCRTQQKKYFWMCCLGGLCAGWTITGLLVVALGLGQYIELELCLLFFLSFVGIGIGSWFGRIEPFQAKYWQANRTVALRFPSAFFTERLIAHVQRVDEDAT
jgi:hypothetical protein